MVAGSNPVIPTTFNFYVTVKKKVFLTNDDGVYAVGLSALEYALNRDRFSVFTVAPLYEKSGASHSITLEKPLRVKKLSESKYAVDGTPVDSVFVGINELVPERPAIAFSGINKGANIGNDLAYSGTVAAAIEAFNNGITSVAVSLFISDYFNFDDVCFEKCAELFVSKILPEIENKTEELYAKPFLFNVNIPQSALEKDSVLIKWTFPGKRNYGGEVIKRVDPRGKEYFWIGGDQYSFADIPGSDCNAVLEGAVSISPLKLSYFDEERTNFYSNK